MIEPVETTPMTQPDEDLRRAFVEARQKGIGATDAAALLGLSPWATRLKVYHDKVDPPVVDEPSLPAWLGLKMQATVAELYAAQEGVKVRADNRHHFHPEDPWMVCHLDYRVVGKPGRLVECKTSSHMVGWGEPYTEDVPVWYWTQCQHEMFVTGTQECDLPVLFGHHTFRVYRIKRNDVFLAKYRQAARDFWHDNVLARVEPPLDGSQYARQLVSSRYPADEEPLKPATPEQTAVVERLRLAVQNAAQAEGAVEELKTQVKDLIGTASGLTGTFGKITWKRSKDSLRTEWGLVAGSLRTAYEQAWARLSVRARQALVRQGHFEPDNLDTLVGLYQRTEPGSRRFLMDWREQE